MSKISPKQLDWSQPISGSVLPYVSGTVTSSFNIGSATQRWGTVYADRIESNLSNTASFITSASSTDDTVTFSKGDGSSFDIIIDNVETASTASYVSSLNVDDFPTFSASISNRTLANEDDISNLQDELDTKADITDLYHAEVSSTPPANPFGGDIWHRTTDAKTFVWNGTAWIDVGAAIPTEGITGEILTKTPGGYDWEPNVSGGTETITNQRVNQNNLIKTVARLNYENSLTAISYKGGTYDIFVDTSTIASQNQVTTFTLDDGNPNGKVQLSIESGSNYYTSGSFVTTPIDLTIDLPTSPTKVVVSSDLTLLTNTTISVVVSDGTNVIVITSAEFDTEVNCSSLVSRILTATWNLSTTDTTVTPTINNYALYFSE